MGRQACAFQVSLRRRPERSKLLAQPRLTQLPSHERSLHPNAALYILEYQTVAMRTNHDAKSAADLVDVIPTSEPRCLQRRPKLFPGPACEAVDSMVGFAIGSPWRNVLALPLVRPRPKGRQAELPLEGPGPGEELLVVPGGRMNPKGLRVDLVDRDVDVLVIGVAVTHRDVLVLGKPQGIHKPFHNLLELSSFEAPIVGVK